jgi:hypothetical protein
LESRSVLVYYPLSRQHRIMFLFPKLVADARQRWARAFLDPTCGISSLKIPEIYWMIRAGQVSQYFWLNIALRGICRALELAALLFMCAGIILVGSVIMAAGGVVNLGSAIIEYIKAPKMVVIDVLAACTRLDHWARLVIACVMSDTKLIDTWLATPIVVSIANGQFTRAIVRTDSPQGRAAAIVYRLCEPPTVNDLQKVLEMCELTEPCVSYKVDLLGEETSRTVNLCIRFDECLVAINEGAPQNISFQSLDLDILLCAYAP